MATYPTSVPDLTALVVQGMPIENMNTIADEIEAIMNSLGTNPQGAGGTVGNRIATIEGVTKVQPVAVSVVDSSAITNTTTLTPFSSGQYTVPANTAIVGRTFRITAGGVVSTAGTTQALTFTIGWGNTGADPVLFLSAIVAPASMNNNGWSFTALVTIRTIGASGTAVSAGQLFAGIVGSNSLGPGVVTINTTATKVLSLFVQWGT